MSTTFTTDYLARAAEKLGWDESPAGLAKREEDLALLQELMTATTELSVDASLRASHRSCGAPDRHPQDG